LIQIGLLVLEKTILENFQCIFILLLLSPLGDMVAPLHMNNFESPSPKDDLCKLWLQLAQWFWGRS
jgi:hypothetical protein